MPKKDFFKSVASKFKNCKNPDDLKASIIAKVVALEPLSVVADNGAFVWTENDQLEISEWFRFRCNIDKESDLSVDVVEALNNAKGIAETHSASGTPCNMPNAISYLADAIIIQNTALLALKCDLKVGDFVEVASLEQDGRYIVLDKIL